MKILSLLFIIALALLSVAAGGAKVAQVPQETAFFADAGIPNFWMIPFGLLQIGGAILAVIGRTRAFGLVAVGIGFLMSSLMIMATGNTQFAIVSVVPAVLAFALLIWTGSKRRGADSSIDHQ